VSDKILPQKYKGDEQKRQARKGEEGLKDDEGGRYTDDRDHTLRCGVWVVREVKYCARLYRKSETEEEDRRGKTNREGRNHVLAV